MKLHWKAMEGTLGSCVRGPLTLHSLPTTVCAAVDSVVY